MSITPRRGRGKAQASLDLIQAAYEICKAANPITVRGIAYKLFARGLIPNMGKNATSRVSRLLVYAREQDIFPWEWIVDETRGAERVNTWSSPDEIIRAAVNGYRQDYWQNQPNWVEVWSEKGTVRGVLRPVLDELGVTFNVMHGFGSATVVKDAAKETQRADKPLTLLYVGDWDPSGAFMSSVDISRRVDRYGGECHIRRIALTRQDTESGLPSFPAATKAADPRYKWFVERFGDRCWELDAMDPNTLRDRVRFHIEALIDREAWDHAVKVEAAEVASMHQFHEAWRQSISRQDAKYSEVAR